MDIVIKKMETDEEKRGKAYVHWKSWQEAYPGIVSQEFLDNLSIEKCEKWAFDYPDNTLVAKDGEKVVGCHADVEHLRILWLEAALDDMQVVCIHLCLVWSHRVRPSAHVAHDVLHVEVAAFHDAHLDGCAALFHAFAGKLQKF